MEKKRSEGIGECFWGIFKRKDGWILRNVAGSEVLIPVGDTIASFNGYIKLNNSAAFLWKELEEEKTAEELVSGLEEQFDILCTQAAEDVYDFLEELKKNNMLLGV